MKYSELSEEAKARALDAVRESESEFFTGEWVVDDWKTILDYMGFNGVEIYWTGFCSQGDGACFTGSWHACDVKPDKLIEHMGRDRAHELGWFALGQHGLYKLLKQVENDSDDDADKNSEGYLMWGTVTHRDRYYHEHSVEYTFTHGAGEDTEEQFKEWCLDMMRMIYRALETEYEYVTSDEQVMEHIHANEFDFDEDGRWI